MSYRKRSVLFSPRLLNALRSEPLTVVDVGARGDSIEPFRSLLRTDGARGAVRTVAFEPDREAGRVGSGAASVDWIPAAAWSVAGSIKLHITEEPSASSVYEPDMQVLSRYRLPHELPRRPVRTVDVDAITVDDAMKSVGADPDFIKLDTQGAEFEILEGAHEALQRSTAVLAETWTAPVHRGQHCLEDVLTLMRSEGYAVADLLVGGRWQHRTSQEARLDSKGDAVVVHVLFLNERGSVDAGWSELKLLKAAALADVWGHADVALQLLAGAPASPDLAWAAQEISHRRSRRRRGSRIRDAMAELACRLFGVDIRSHPPLG